MHQRKRNRMQPSLRAAVRGLVVFASVGGVVSAQASDRNPDPAGMPASVLALPPAAPPVAPHLVDELAAFSGSLPTYGHPRPIAGPLFLTRLGLTKRSAHGFRQPALASFPAEPVAVPDAAGFAVAAVSFQAPVADVADEADLPPVVESLSGMGDTALLEAAIALSSTTPLSQPLLVPVPAMELAENLPAGTEDLVSLADAFTFEESTESPTDSLTDSLTDIQYPTASEAVDKSGAPLANSSSAVRLAQRIPLTIRPAVAPQLEQAVVAPPQLQPEIAVRSGNARGRILEAPRSGVQLAPAQAFRLQDVAEEAAASPGTFRLADLDPQPAEIAVPGMSLNGPPQVLAAVEPPRIESLPAMTALPPEFAAAAVKPLAAPASMAELVRSTDMPAADASQNMSTQPERKPSRVGALIVAAPSAAIVQAAKPPAPLIERRVTEMPRPVQAPVSLALASAVEVDSGPHAELLAELRQSIQEAFPNSRVNVSVDSEEFLVVTGQAVSESEARKILSLVRKRTLMPVTDQVITQRRF
jgi:hypothetical protein